MRKKLIVAIAAIAVLAFAGIALAKQVQTADIKFTKSKAGGPTAIDSTFKVSDPANKTAGQVGKPTKQIKEVDINFPTGMKFNYKAAPVCTQTQPTLITAKCKKAHLASGSTKIDARGSQGILSATLDAYNEKQAGKPSGLAIVLHASSPLVNNQVLFPTLSGSKLKTVLPIGALKLIKGYLTDFHLVIPIKHGSSSGKGKKFYYATLPKKCPKGGKFIVKTKYFYDAGGSFTTKGTVNKCKK